MTMRTPLGRVRGLGSAKSGTGDFWLQRVTAVAAVPLTIAGVWLMISLTGRSYTSVKQILASPLVAVLMLLFILTNVVHMRIGMQEIIVDYVHDEKQKLALLLLNTFYVIAIGLACAFAILKLSFGVV